MAASVSDDFKCVTLKVIVLGDSGVGKTALLNRYVYGELSKRPKPTIGASFLTKELMFNTPDAHGCPARQLVQLQLWDTGARQENSPFLWRPKTEELRRGFRPLSLDLCRGADCGVLVYDATDSDSRTYESLGGWRDQLLDQLSLPDPREFPFIVLGNKADLLGEATEIFATPRERESSLAWNKMPRYMTSAVEGTGVEEVFHEVAEMALKQCI